MIISQMVVLNLLTGATASAAVAPVARRPVTLDWRRKLLLLKRADTVGNRVGTSTEKIGS